MRQNIIKIISFLVTFFIALNILSTIMNMGNTDMTVEMSKASIPTVSVLSEGHEVNRMQGYTGNVKANYLRDALTPISEDRKIYVKINGYGEDIAGVSYEVRSLDTTRLVENTEIYDYVHDGDSINAVISIKDLIDKQQEYLLVLIIKMEDGKEVRYFTRIVEDEMLHTKEQLDYVIDFHNKTFDKEQAKSIVTYLESNELGDNTTYQHVDIHSSFNQITWGDLNIIEKDDFRVRILDMDPQLASISLDYKLKVKNGKNVEQYLVDEFYRIRYTDERIYLLDYERNMNQLFDPDCDVFINDKIILGITDEIGDFRENADGSVVLFSQENALYEYRNSEGTLARLFSFFDNDNIDARTTNQDHRVKVLSMDEAGNVMYLVYGYMNRGMHEGDVGISVRYYDNAKNSIEERVYIPYDKSFGLLDLDLSVLAYANVRNQLYLYLENSIYCINLDSCSCSVIAENIERDKIVTSKDNKMVAWKAKDYSVTLTNLATGGSREVKDENGGNVLALGFIGEDFVYGIARAKDVIKDITGTIINPMHTIVIENKKGDVLKNYSEPNIYVTSVDISDTTIKMKRIYKDETDNTYMLIDDDQIMNSIQEEMTKNSIIEVVTEDKETVMELALTSNVANSIHLQTPKEVLIEGGRAIKLAEGSETDNSFYVYAKGSINGVFDKPFNAVECAAELNGVVVNAGQEYIWQKGNRKQRVEITAIEPMAVTEGTSSLAVCLDSILAYEGTPRNSQYLFSRGETAMSLLKNNIDGNVLDLSGCDLNSVLYYVSNQTPVLSYVEDEDCVLIVGYDEKNTIIMDPRTGTTYKKGMNDSTEWFLANGNSFVAYTKNN